MTAPVKDTGFSRMMTLEEAQRHSAPFDYAARDDECAAIARHFRWSAVGAFNAKLHFAGIGTQVDISGRLLASVTQPCVVTSRPISERIDVPFVVRLVPYAMLDGDDEDEERELDADAMDMIGYRDGRFDLGAIIAETLALSVNPWPRAPDADAWLAKHGGGDDGSTGPFAALAALRGQAERD